MGISENIKNIRTKVGMTQAQLAQAVKVNQSMIGLIETGRKIPSLMLTMDIANYGKVFAGTYSQERFERGLQRMCAYD